MKKLGISIDGILRDFNTQFEKIYRKKFILNEGLVGMTDDFQVKEFTDQDAEEANKLIQAEESKRIKKLPVDSDLLNHFLFEEYQETIMNLEGEPIVKTISPKEALNRFIEAHPFQILAQAPEMIQSAIEYCNKIQAYGLEKGLFETILIEKNTGTQIPATLTFLATKHSRVRNISFVDQHYKKWEHCDILIESIPESIQTKSEGQKIIKVDSLINQWEKDADYSVKDIKDAYNLIISKNIFE